MPKKQNLLRRALNRELKNLLKPPKLPSNKKHLEGDGSICPLCGTGNSEGKSLDFDFGVISQDMTCNTCGASWTNHYELKRYDTVKDGSGHLVR